MEPIMMRQDRNTILTKGERLVYAAAFAVQTVMHMPCKMENAIVSAWVAVLLLRDDAASRLALHQSVDWDAARAMHDSFKSGK